MSCSIIWIFLYYVNLTSSLKKKDLLKFREINIDKQNNIRFFKYLKSLKDRIKKLSVFFDLCNKLF